VQHRLHALAESSWRATAQRSGLLIEALSGLEAIKTQAAESPMQARWERHNLFLAQVTLRMRALSNTTLYGVSWAVQAVGIAVVVIGVYLIGERELTLGALVAASLLSSRALAPAGQVVGLLMQLQGARTALEGLNKLMALPDERGGDGVSAGGGRLQRRELAGAIRLRDLAFRYPGSELPALSGVQLDIRPGEQVAVIGRMGSGKTSLLRVIAGLYPPSEGALLLDGVDARQFDPADLRRGIAFVSQDVVLFQGTLRENIVLGLPNADDAAVLAAAEAAGLREWVDRHPLGFELPVGERGERLSGGQRQAVGLARALLHATPIVLLDEPTSAMDFSTEAQLTQRLAALLQGRTVVIVTHRSSLLTMAQRLVVLDQGRVVADGPREQVMAALAAGQVGKAAA
jgi:ATP-binding cassette, subfamily C, bacterial LapB